jgi:hypothetical protein
MPGRLSPAGSVGGSRSGFVKCAEGFNATPAAGELPFGMPVEVEAVVAIA